MASIEIRDNQEVIMGVLDMLRRKPLISYAGVDLLFSGKITHGKIDGYFSPPDSFHSKTPNHFDPLSGLAIQGKYNIKEGLINIDVMPAFMFYFSLILPVGGYLIAIYSYCTNTIVPGFYVGLGFGTITTIGISIYYYVFRKKVIKNVFKMFKAVKSNTINKEAN